MAEFGWWKPERWQTAPGDEGIATCCADWLDPHDSVWFSRAGRKWATHESKRCGGKPSLKRERRIALSDPGYTMVYLWFDSFYYQLLTINNAFNTKNHEEFVNVYQPLRLDFTKVFEWILMDKLYMYKQFLIKNVGSKRDR